MGTARFVGNDNRLPIKDRRLSLPLALAMNVSITWIYYLIILWCLT